MVTTYFDLARSTTAVNEELNSQSNKILPGTYKYVSMGFCNGGVKSENVRFQADGMTEAASVQLGTCGLNSTVMDPPIVIAEGESVIVSVQYSLANIVYDFGAAMTKYANCHFNADSSVRRCVNMPDIVPSFVKE